MIEIHLKRCLVVLTETELQRMLFDNPEIYAAALKRGKHAARIKKAYERKGGGAGADLPI